MYKLGVIEESLDSRDALISLEPYLVSQRITEVPGDEWPVWHINEYHVPDAELRQFLPALEKGILPTAYAHAFNDNELIVVLKGKSFAISREKDESWNDMLKYADSVSVERRYSENIPLNI